MKTSKGELSHTSFPSPEATEWRLPPLPDPLQTSGLDPLQILCVLQPCSQGFFLWTCWSSELCYSMEASPWISAVAKVQDSGLVRTERQEALGGGVGWDGVRMTHKKNPTF